MFPTAEINKYLCATTTRQKWEKQREQNKYPFCIAHSNKKKHEFRIVSTWNKQVDRRSSSTKDRNPQANFVITRLLAQEQKQKR